jgi:hypothetical protein
MCWLEKYEVLGYTGQTANDCKILGRKIIAKHPTESVSITLSLVPALKPVSKKYHLVLSLPPHRSKCGARSKDNRHEQNNHKYLHGITDPYAPHMIEIPPHIADNNAAP